MKSRVTLSVGVVTIALLLAACQAVISPSDKGMVEPKSRASSATSAVGDTTVQSYPKPSIYAASSVFSLTANSTDVPVISYVAEYDYAEFSFSGTVNIEITASESISTYSISPLAKNISGTVNGNKLSFSLSTSTYVIVEINSLKKLVIAADPVETDKPASSGTGVFNVTASPYNADKTGTNYSTAPIQSAINAASTYGGGIVYVPAGVYKIGNLQLKTNMKLYLEGGAVLRGSGSPSDYTTHFHKDGQSRDGTWWIYTENGANNVKIYGRGTLDGNGAYMKNTNNYLCNILMVMGTSNFTLDGIILRDSGFWSFILARSDLSTVRNYKHFNSFSMFENDGIDVCESQNVTITNAIGISADDPFSAKTWDRDTTDICANWYGNPEAMSNVTFDGCISWTKSAAYKIGMGTKQPQTGITFKNSVAYDCARAIAVQHSYGTALVKDITFDNIDAEHVRISQWGGPQWLYAAVENSSSLGTGPVENLVFSNINLRDLGANNSILKGFSGSSSFRSVSFSNITVPGGAVAACTSDLKINVGSYVDSILVNGAGGSTSSRAYNRPVTVSSTESGSAANVVDAKLATRWASHRSDPQWIYVDLGSVQSINRVKITWETAYGKSYQIQTSSDTLSWATKYTTTSGDGGIDDISFAATPKTARYVRINCTERGTAYGYSIWELEVYGP